MVRNYSMNIMCIQLLINYLVVITAMLTLSHCSFIVQRNTNLRQLNLDDVDSLMSSAFLTNVTNYANRTIVKRSAYGPSGLPIAIVPASPHDGPEIATSVKLYEYKYPFIASAKIGDHSFACRQDNGQLAVARRLQGTRRLVIQFMHGEFFLHPKPGMWWFVRCQGMETGGAGLDVTGVQKPGGDSGIDPNALKSLVG